MSTTANSVAVNSVPTIFPPEKHPAIDPRSFTGQLRVTHANQSNEKTWRHLPPPPAPPPPPPLRRDAHGPKSSTLPNNRPLPPPPPPIPPGGSRSAARRTIPPPPPCLPDSRKNGHIPKRIPPPPPPLRPNPPARSNEVVPLNQCQHAKKFPLPPPPPPILNPNDKVFPLNLGQHARIPPPPPPLIRHAKDNVSTNHAYHSKFPPPPARPNPVNALPNKSTVRQLPPPPPRQPPPRRHQLLSTGKANDERRENTSAYTKNDEQLPQDCIQTETQQPTPPRPVASSTVRPKQQPPPPPQKSIVQSKPQGMRPPPPPPPPPWHPRQPKRAASRHQIAPQQAQLMDNQRGRYRSSRQSDIGKSSNHSTTDSQTISAALPSTDQDVHLPLLRTLSYLLLGLSCTQKQETRIQRVPEKLETIATHFDRFGLGKIPVGIYASAREKAQNLFDRESHQLDAQARAPFTLPRKPEPVKHRFKRKRRRKVPRETYLSRIGNIDRDLNDDEFESLVRDLAETPFEVKEYEEIVEVEEKAEPGSSPLRLLVLPKSLRWKTSPAYYLTSIPHHDDEPLSEYEKQLLLESTDEWFHEEESLSKLEEQLLMESTDDWMQYNGNNETSDSEQNDVDNDDLTETELLILSEASALGSSLETESQRISRRWSESLDDDESNGLANISRVDMASPRQFHSETLERRPSLKHSRSANGDDYPNGHARSSNRKSGFLSWMWRSPPDVPLESDTQENFTANKESTVSPNGESTSSATKRIRPAIDMNLGESASGSINPALRKKTLEFGSTPKVKNQRPPDGFRYVRDDQS